MKLFFAFTLLIVSTSAVAAKTTSNIECSAFMINSELNKEVFIKLLPADYDKKFLTGKIGFYKFGALTHDVAKNEIYLTFADTRTENTSVTYSGFFKGANGKKEARLTHYDYNDPSGARVVYRVTCTL